MIRRTLVLAAVLCLAAAATAAADAPDPIVSQTHLVQPIQQNADGSFTVTIAGAWQWTTHHSDCSTDRAGVGYAIDWHDASQSGNQVGKGSLIANVGTPTDNVVRSVPPNNSDVSSPSSFASWRGGCGTFNGTYNTGTWGPISHTYPASHSGDFVVCPIMYDVHGKQAGTAPNSAKEITAGGNGHNSDNSIETNGDTPLGNGCFTSSFSPPSPPPPPPPAPPAPTPGIRVVKEQRLDNSTAAYTTNVLTGTVGQKVDYEMIVTNTGNTTLTLSFSDPRCDAGTLTGPFGGVNSDGTLPAGAQTVWFCSHILAAADAPAFTNTVTVNGIPASGTAVVGTSSVTTNVALSGTKAAKKKVKKKKHKKHRKITPHFTG
jgi:hypothetical protein